ncbi:hypothetical protein Poli38472_004080 [Pythium oligandrum]|uniref:Calmodulin n=1 Tax=Pythium oligandrum TaxID=41045 RepID=A0A8K1FJQ6_PYTOL|nr:hypothetical protein Poli38472_004080 [Pythium oligandrum]|eukprot:TMW66315.1 hypothetical protein Poli38472_004080 [Pythium oligandrum]
MIAMTQRVLLLLGFIGTVQARQEFVARIPNGDFIGEDFSLGHTEADEYGEVELNDFGKAFAAAGHKWTPALCFGDADGDGQSNGAELGDPCCLWQEGAVPLITEVMSHPGDPNSHLGPVDVAIRQAVCRAVSRLSLDGSDDSLDDSASNDDDASDSDSDSDSGSSSRNVTSHSDSDDGSNEASDSTIETPAPSSATTVWTRPAAHHLIVPLSFLLFSMPQLSSGSKDASPQHRSPVQDELEALYQLFRLTGGEKGAWRVSIGWDKLAHAVEQSADALMLRGSMEMLVQLHGVVWERNHVVSIDLSDNGLHGRLPRALVRLRYLKLLKLRQNPDLRGELPFDLFQMPRLRYGYLDGTRIENVLPLRLAHSFQITQLYSAKPGKRASAAATVTFQTGTGGQATFWWADMTESELLSVHTSLKARHEKPQTVVREVKVSASNATGPERVEAAIKLQRIYRARIERTKFRAFLRSLFEKHYDTTTGYEYFVDKRTGESMWERPKHIGHTPRKTADGDENNNEDIWQVFDDGHGNTYYWNRITGESTWEPPVFMTRIYQELRSRYGADKTDEERFALFFQDIDKDSTGSIDRDEFARLCGDLAMAMSPVEITTVFAELDTSGDGELNREELIAWLTRHYS